MKGVVDDIIVKAIRIKKKKRMWWSLWLHVKEVSVAAWELMGDFDWHGITVPKGFITDFGSIPKFLRFFINPVGLLRPGFIIHDFLYQIFGILPKPIVRNGVTKKVLNKGECDHELFDIGVAVDYDPIKNKAVLRGLQIGGGPSWNKNNPIKKAA